MARPWIAAVFFVALLATAGRPAAAELPEAVALLVDLGFSSDQIRQVQSGSIVRARIEPSSERELVAALAFWVGVAPNQLVDHVRSGLLDRLSNSSVYPVSQGAPNLTDFLQLTLGPDAQARAQVYAKAQPSGDLNLSSAEIASFDALRGSSPTAIEQAIRSALLERLQAYQARGLAGIAPYARSDGRLRSAGDELRSATLATKPLKILPPAALQLLLDYPADMPPGTQEAFRWSESQANDVPTLLLMHNLAVPDGSGWIVARRQFYVSTGYNCAQSIARYLPMQGGTLVIYTNRSSTDEVTGFGGGLKREIGNRLLARRLEDLYARFQDAVK